MCVCFSSGIQIHVYVKVKPQDFCDIFPHLLCTLSPVITCKTIETIDILKVKCGQNQCNTEKLLDFTIFPLFSNRKKIKQQKLA